LNRAPNSCWPNPPVLDRGHSFQAQINKTAGPISNRAKLTGGLPWGHKFKTRAGPGGKAKSKGGGGKPGGIGPFGAKKPQPGGPTSLFPLGWPKGGEKFPGGEIPLIWGINRTRPVGIFGPGFFNLLRPPGQTPRKEQTRGPPKEGGPAGPIFFRGGSGPNFSRAPSVNPRKGPPRGTRDFKKTRWGSGINPRGPRNGY